MMAGRTTASESADPFEHIQCIMLPNVSLTLRGIDGSFVSETKSNPRWWVSPSCRMGGRPLVLGRVRHACDRFDPRRIVPSTAISPIPAMSC
jgi:hypothetical protein